MEKPSDKRDLDIEEDLDFQRRDWVFERVGFGLMLAGVAAGLAGVFGGGPLSRGSALAPDGSLRVEHDRLARWQSPEELQIRVGPEHVRDGRVVLWLRRDLLESHSFEDITPDPIAVSARQDRCTYEFLGSGELVTVTFHLRSERWGLLHGAAGVEGGPALSFSQLVYP